MNWLGLVLIKSMEVSIGGQQINKHYGDYMYILNQLTQSAGKKEGYANMVGNVPKLTQLYTANESDGADVVIPSTTLFIPLEFWFFAEMRGSRYLSLLFNTMR